MSYIEKYLETQSSWAKVREKVRRHEFNILKRFIQKYDSVLEVGSGDGVETTILIESFKKVIICEPDESVCKAIRDKFSVINPFVNLEIIQRPIEKTPLCHTLGRLDCIFMGHVLEHIENPVEALKKIREIATYDTVIYISVPNANSFHRIAGVEMSLMKNTYELFEHDFIFGHYRTYDMNRLKSHILDAGLKIQETGGIIFKPLTNKQLEEIHEKNPEIIDAYLKMGNLFPENAGEIYAICYK